MAARRLLGLMVSLIAALMVVGSPVAHAFTVVELDREQGVLWSAVTVDDAADSVKVVYKAPSKKGTGRVVWQRCSMPAAGVSTYRCGIDVAPGSLAAERTGSWAVTVFVDGTLIAQRTFTIR